MKLLKRSIFLIGLVLFIFAGCENPVEPRFLVKENDKPTVSAPNQESSPSSNNPGERNEVTLGNDGNSSTPENPEESTPVDKEQKGESDASNEVVTPEPKHRSYYSFNMMEDPKVNEISRWSKYDARTENLVTPVKHQYDPICWAFATASALETAMIKKGFATKDEVDISEYTLAYSRYGYGQAALKGAAPSSMANILCGWNGVENDIVGTDNRTALVTTACSILTKAGGGREEVEEAISKMKKAIAAYGSIVISYYETNSDYSSSSGRYWGGYKKSNHAVTVVGWDDDFSDFTTNPTANGAWLVKNSWGEGWNNGNAGYFWLSYYDATIAAKAFYVDVVENNTYNVNYQYDDARPEDSLISSYGSAQVLQAANVYTTQNELEELKAVQFGMAYDGMSYKISIYRGLSDPKNPTSGEYEVEVIGGQLPMGRHTIELPHTIQLKKDEVFSVVVTFTTNPGQNPSVEYEDQGTAQAGQSFYRRSLKDEWIDVKDESKGNIRIKAFTKTL